jgi:hypothetical protein
MGSSAFFLVCLKYCRNGGIAFGHQSRQGWTRLVLHRRSRWMPEVVEIELRRACKN